MLRRQEKGLRNYCLKQTPKKKVFIFKYFILFYLTNEGCQIYPKLIILLSICFLPESNNIVQDLHLLTNILHKNHGHVKTQSNTYFINLTMMKQVHTYCWSMLLAHFEEIPKAWCLLLMLMIWKLKLITLYSNII